MFVFKCPFLVEFFRGISAGKYKSLSTYLSHTFLFPFQSNASKRDGRTLQTGRGNGGLHRTRDIRISSPTDTQTAL